MKKISLFLTACLLLFLPLTVQADSSVFQSPRTNFQHIQDLVLEGINMTSAKNTNLDKLAAEKVESYLEAALLERKIPLSLNDPLVIYPSTGVTTSSGKLRTKIAALQKQQQAGLTKEQNTPVYPFSLAVNINDYGYSYVDRAGYWDTYTDWIEHEWQDHKGNWHHDSIPVTRTRYIPPTTVKICYVDIEFSLYDTATNKLVWNKRDTRDRETNTPDDMARRICKDMAEDLQKLHDKGKT